MGALRRAHVLTITIYYMKAIGLKSKTMGNRPKLCRRQKCQGYELNITPRLADGFGGRHGDNKNIYWVVSLLDPCAPLF